MRALTGERIGAHVVHLCKGVLGSQENEGTLPSTVTQENPRA